MSSLLVFPRSFRSIHSITVTMETTLNLHLTATTLWPPGILGKLLENRTLLCCHWSSWQERISLPSTFASSRTAPSSLEGSVHTNTGTYRYTHITVHTRFCRLRSKRLKVHTEQLGGVLVNTLGSQSRDPFSSFSMCWFLSTASLMSDYSKLAAGGKVSINHCLSVCGRPVTDCLLAQVYSSSQPEIYWLDRMMENTVTAEIHTNTARLYECGYESSAHYTV